MRITMGGSTENDSLSEQNRFSGFYAWDERCIPGDSACRDFSQGRLPGVKNPATASRFPFRPPGVTGNGARRKAGTKIF